MIVVYIYEDMSFLVDYEGYGYSLDEMTVSSISIMNLSASRYGSRQCAKG
jgi:hypothetical protein